jgi:predicted MFS family arabinose efflux permease
MSQAFIGLVPFNLINVKRARKGPASEDNVAAHRQGGQDGAADAISLFSLDEPAPVDLISWPRSYLIMFLTAFVAGSNAILFVITFIILPDIDQTLSIRPIFDVMSFPIHNLVYANCLLLAGLITHAFGPRTTFLGGLALQTVSVVTCAVAWNGQVFLISRTFLSAIAMALIAPSTTAIVVTSMGDQQRTVAYAMIAIGQSIGVIAGYPIAAFLSPAVGLKYWRLVYIVIGALYAIALLVAAVALPARIDKPADHDKRARLSWKERWRGLTQDIDWVGFLLQFAATSTLGMSAIGLAWLPIRLQKPLCISGILLTVVLASCFVL